MSVKNEHADYSAMVSRWKQCRDAAEGEHAVHLAGEQYLPKLQEEHDKSYALRLSMTPWFNATWRTISGLRGMMFRKQPDVEVPASLVDVVSDIDLAGTTLQGMAQEVAEEALTVGRVGLLVDYPQSAPGLTLADTQAMGLRALISTYKAESIINWRTDRIHGATVLSMVVLTEEAQLPGEDEFTFGSEKRYRVLDLVDGKYRQRVFRINDKGEDEQVDDDVFPMMNNAAMDFIPFVFIGVDCVGPELDTPPLIDLVTMNFKHYGQATSYERGCFFSGLPTMFISGHNSEDGKIYLGGNMANSLSRPEAKAYFVEVSSEFNALRNNLADKKAEMAVLGARMLESQKASVESAEAIARRQNGEESLLSSMSQTIGMGITRALQWLSDWQGVTGEVKCELNRDFMPASMTAQDLTALVGAWQAGAISRQVLFDNLKSGEMIDGDVSFDDEQERIDGSTPLGMIADATPSPVAQDQTAHNDAMKAASDQHNATIQAILSKVSEPQPAVDMQAVADAIKAIPAPVVNVAAPIINIPEQQAPTINIAPAAVNISPPAITVNMPESQPVAQAPIVLNTGTGGRVIEMVRDKAGKITGANVTEAG